MKKFLAMLVAAMMVLSLVAIPVLADGEVVFAVENAPATATPGDEITVNLTVNGTFEAHVLNMQFNYNADAFEYVSHTRGDVLNQIIDLGGTQLVDATTIPGSMRLGVMMPTAAFTQSGTICSVTLRVKEGAANGASDLALVITEFKNFPTGGQATPIANVVNNATVTITGGSEPTHPAAWLPSPSPQVMYSATVPVTRCSSMQMQPHSAMRSPQKVLSPWAAMHPQVCTMHSSIRFP